MMDWKPISTAPEELSQCLLWCTDLRIGAFGVKEPYGVVMGRLMWGKPYGTGMNGDWTFTHWMPLPPEPAQ